MIYFANPTELDLRLVGTFGVNVKEGDNPIGYFGTGMKYAIAVILREGGTITIGGTLLHVQTEEIRGKPFKFVYLGKTGLGFTTDLGKNWTLRHAYRELYCNALDEGGRVFEDRAIVPAGWRTVIAVSGLDATHAARFEFILDQRRQKIAETNILDIYLGKSRQVFYRGIGVLNLRDNEQSLFTYNIKDGCTLTEDRTISSWEAQHAVEYALASEAIDASIIHDAITSKDCFEARLCFEYRTPSDAFLDVVAQALKQAPLTTNASAKVLFYKTSPEKIEFEAHAVTGVEGRAIEEAIVTIEPHFPTIRGYEMFVATDLGDSILGRAMNGKIYLAARVLAMPILIDTIFEEFVHLEFGVGDHTREMQNLLFNFCVKFMRGGVA